MHLHEYCIFTGGKRRIVTNNFRGGEIVAVFGGVEVDLRAAQLGGDEAVVDITAAFGGCNIKVPTNWYVEMRGVAAFGGYSNKTIPPRVSPGQRIQKLVVTGSSRQQAIERRLGVDEKGGCFTRVEASLSGKRRQAIDERLAKTKKSFDRVTQ